MAQKEYTGSNVAMVACLGVLGRLEQWAKFRDSGATDQSASQLHYFLVRCLWENY